MADHSRNHRGSRSRSPSRHHRHHHRDRSPIQRTRERLSTSTALLPFHSCPLTKHDATTYKPLFALYLDIQKGKVLEDMDEKESKGRWKSFIGKWNRGELSEGWYAPATLQKAMASASEAVGTADCPTIAQVAAVATESDVEIGPSLPGHHNRARPGRQGPSVPSLQDLELKREMDHEDAVARGDAIRFARNADRKEQKAALDELLPRADAGSRERQLEKKKEVNERMKSFRERSPGAAVEVPDTELMGGVDGLESYKKERQDFERKKNERELRKEETLRARIAEREERLQEYRAKEEGTMEMLKALAKQRFG